MNFLQLAKGPTQANRFLDATDRFARNTALRWKELGAWREMTYAELRQQTLALSASLKDRGVRPGDRIAVWIETCRQWIIADSAIQILGGVTIPIYHSISAEEALFILNDCNATGLVSSQRRIAAMRKQSDAPKSVFCVSIDGGPDALAFSDLLSEGEKLLRTRPEWRSSLENPEVRPEDLSAVIYTSGTTGRPKGAMITHANITDTCLDSVISCFLAETGHTLLLHLPMAHIMARNITAAAILYSGGCLAIAEPEREKLFSNLSEVAPTAFVTVPYLLDKFMTGVMDKIRSQGRLKRLLTKIAISIGRRKHLGSIASGRLVPFRRGPLFLLLDRLVLKKIRGILGGRLEWIIVGGANSNLASVEFFWSIGIPIYEGYGATEVTNAAAHTWSGGVRLGSVGRPTGGVEIKLADDGEVLVRGPNVMKGYWNRPEATREAIDAEGWYLTGDIGQIDSGGFLKIVDRKKEIYVLATGKNVAPQLVENSLKLSSCIAQAFAVGDRRRFISALIVPDLKAIQNRLGLAEPLSFQDSRVEQIVREEIDRTTGKLSPHERVKLFVCVPESFTVENGMMTPTLKLRRKAITQRYSKEIEALYYDNHH